MIVGNVKAAVIGGMVGAILVVGAGLLMIRPMTHAAVEEGREVVRTEDGQAAARSRFDGLRARTRETAARLGDEVHGLGDRLHG